MLFLRKGNLGVGLGRLLRLFTLLIIFDKLSEHGWQEFRVLFDQGQLLDDFSLEFQGAFDLGTDVLLESLVLLLCFLLVTRQLLDLSFHLFGCPFALFQLRLVIGPLLLGISQLLHQVVLVVRLLF